jgi:hypothetical protein
MILAVPAAVLGGEVINVVERVFAENNVHLLVFARIGLNVLRILALNDIGRMHIVSPPAKLVHEICSDKTPTPGN